MSFGGKAPSVEPAAPPPPPPLPPVLASSTTKQAGAAARAAATAAAAGGYADTLKTSAQGDTGQTNTAGKALLSGEK